jgi:uncharacterized protein
MFVNIPLAVQSAVANANAPHTGRPVYMEEFADGSGFAFNAENPNGVKYLTPMALMAYKELLNRRSAAARVDVNKFPYYKEFVQHRLIDSNETAPKMEFKNNKAFNVWFHISNACNLACSYCYIPKLMKAVDLRTMDRHFMDSSTVAVATKSLFDFCRDNQFKELQIKFAGGEPTLNRERMNECCEMATLLSKQYGIPVSFSILTNGVFIDDDIFDTLVKYKFKVSISMDGDRDRHNEVRFVIPRSQPGTEQQELKRTGSWQTIDKNIDSLLSLGIRPFILCTISERNHQHLIEFVKYTVSKKIGFRFSLIRDKHSHKKEGLENNILSELIRVYEWLGENMPGDMPIENYARFAEWDLNKKKQAVCGTCRSTMSIDQQGKVASCQMHMDSPGGNVHEESLTTIFFKIRGADENKYLTNPQDKSGDCSICYWKFTCAGGCPEHTRMAMGTANSPSPWCNLYKNLLPHYLRAIAKQLKASFDRKEFA